MSGGFFPEAGELVVANTVSTWFWRQTPNAFVNSDSLVDNISDAYIPLKAPNSEAPSCSSARQADE